MPDRLHSISTLGWVFDRIIAIQVYSRRSDRGTGFDRCELIAVLSEGMWKLFLAYTGEHELIDLCNDPSDTDDSKRLLEEMKK